VFAVCILSPILVSGKDVAGMGVGTHGHPWNLCDTGEEFWGNPSRECAQSLASTNLSWAFKRNQNLQIQMSHFKKWRVGQSPQTPSWGAPL